jgi:2-polyprenyl-3-methyl-5-hydroxy-6-metoxy-1,4-benzoquinol methylase
MERKSHWEEVYRSKAPSEVSWYQPRAGCSLEIIQRVAPDRAAPIIDVGGGASVLVDELLSDGYSDLTVLDMSAAALATTQKRLGKSAQRVQWLEVDVLEVELPKARFEVWHDRAVFHFLISPQDQQRYVEQVRFALRPGGHLAIATFAEEGPTRCSGLEVQRYSPESLERAFEPHFRLLSTRADDHTTPTGKRQAFIYCTFQATL